MPPRKTQPIDLRTLAAMMQGPPPAASPIPCDHEVVVELTKLAAPRPTFGEFLVTHQVIDRYQLFRALQMQDRMPRARLGQCAVALGYVHHGAIEHLHVRFTQSLDAALEAAETEAFVREHEPEVLIEVACTT